MDSASRENEGDLIIAAQDFTAAQAAFMIRYTSGYLCAPLTPALAARLELPQMVARNADPNRTAYTVTVDAADPAVTTGISAHDRALTVRALASPSPAVTAAAFSRPGHMVPLRAREGGVLVRRGHTESALDLCEIAGLPRAGVLCELVDGEDEEGGMLRRDGCRRFADRWGLKMISVEMLVRWREAHPEEKGVAPAQAKAKA